MVGTLLLGLALHEREWGADGGKDITNFSITTITKVESTDPFNGWYAAMGSTSIQHHFDGIVAENSDSLAIIEVKNLYFYIRDGFDFIDDDINRGTQLLGAWHSTIFNPEIPYVLSYPHLTNKTFNVFSKKYGIGADFRIIFTIEDTHKAFNKIIYDKRKNTIRYEK